MLEFQSLPDNRKRTATDYLTFTTTTTVAAQYPHEAGRRGLRCLIVMTSAPALETAVVVSGRSHWATGVRMSRPSSCTSLVAGAVI